MKLPLLIAKRYLFAKKSHNVINIISAISAAGMAIGTAALIVILAVYNGFSSLVADSVSLLEPDLLVEKKEGKVFNPQEAAVERLRALKGVSGVSETLKENIFITYDGQSGAAVAIGVDSLWEANAPIADKIVDGKHSLSKGDIPQALVGVGFAYKMGISPRLLIPVQLYFPDRNKKISVSNPAASLRSVKVWTSGLFSITTDTDNSIIITKLGAMRELLDYDTEVSALEIRADGLVETARLQEEVQEIVGPGFTVKDRYHQNEALYKMMSTEKAVVFLVLIFIVIIIAFNIFGSLTMLMIEKEDDIKTLRSLGARTSLIRITFVLEGWLITLMGLAAGVVLGLLLVLAQKQFGFVKMPGDFALLDYPVVINWLDITITAISVAVIGYIIALIPARRSIPQEGT